MHVFIRYNSVYQLSLFLSLAPQVKVGVGQTGTFIWCKHFSSGIVLVRILETTLEFSKDIFEATEWNVECFKYLGSLLTNDGRCTREIKFRIAMAKAAFSKKKTLFTSKLNLNLRKKLIKCYIWSMVLYGAKT